MGTVQRTSTIPAAWPDVWQVVADAHHLPRWWPGVQRVENVTDTNFTEVFYTRNGRPVRIDFRYVEVETGRLLGWEQDIIGTQFERLLSLWRTRLTLEPAGAGTVVRLEEEQRFRTSFRTGALLQRRAAKKRLDGALTGLRELF